MHDGRAIHLDHFQHFFCGNFVSVAEGAETGVIDQEFDFEFFRGGEIVDLLRSFGLGEVGGADFDLDIMGGLQLGGDLLQAIGAAGGEDQVRPVGREEPGEFEANAGAGSSD